MVLAFGDGPGSSSWPGQKSGPPPDDGPGQSSEGHRVTAVRIGLREPLSLAAALPKGDRGWAKEAPPAVGHDPGRLDSRGWRRAFTLRSRSHPGPSPSSHPPPPAPCRDGARHQGQERGRGAARGTCARGWVTRLGTARARDPRNPGPIPTPGFRRLPRMTGTLC
jgi:hypothetical protein